jgi:biotin operon repressor
MSASILDVSYRSAVTHFDINYEVFHITLLTTNLINSNNIFPYLCSRKTSMSQYSESDGQAHSASRLLRTLSLGSPSIIHMLRARSVTGQGLNIHVDQHYGYRLHATWKITNKQMINDLFATERRFPTYSSVDCFCRGLQTIEDLCTCISVR